MNETISIFEEISNLIISNSLYNKSVEVLNSNSSIDQTIFIQIENVLSKRTNRDEELFSYQNDYLSSLLIFLLEHLPFEIDLNRLISTEINYEQNSKRKLYKPKLFSFHQYTSEAEKVLPYLFKYFQVKNFEEYLLLKQNNQPIYIHCLDLLRPLLLKTTYDKYPIAIQVFVQIIQSMSQSCLSDTLDIIFPVCLITLDDPSIDMKLISFYLLEHLQRNLTTTDLLLFNRADVVLYGLEQNLYRRNDRLIFFECLLSTTYRWLIIIENEAYSGKHLFIRTSQLIDRFIRGSLLETNIDYRRSLLKTLRYYINRLQLFSCRHLKKFIELIDDSIDHRLLRYDSLDLLLIMLEILKPRINIHRYDIMKIVIRCLFKILHEEKEDLATFNLLKKCLKQFQSSTTDNYVQDALKSLINTSQLDLLYRESLQKLLEITE